MEKLITRPIGEIFEYGNDIVKKCQLQVSLPHPDLENSCLSCDFFGFVVCPRNKEQTGACCKQNRTDNTNVVFKFYSPEEK